MRHIFYILFLAAVIERIICTFGKKEREGNVKFKGLTMTLIFTYTISSFLAFFEFLFRKSDINIMFSLIGLITTVCGIILRRKAINTLGKYWSVHIKIYNDHKLVKEGPYKYLKHPYYCAVLLELVGICLLFNAKLAFLFVMLVHTPILLVRAYFESVLLKKLFADY